MKQVQVKRQLKRRERDDPDRDYRDPAIARAKAAKRKQERKS